ncbi:MAG: hypothetical protein ACR5LD_01330 [Symbiopectobacterium sp.]
MIDTLTQDVLEHAIEVIDAEKILMPAIQRCVSTCQLKPSH